MVRFRGSKTDQHNESCLPCIGATGNSRCLIAAIRVRQTVYHDAQRQGGHLRGVAGGLASGGAGVWRGRCTHRHALELRVSCANWLYQSGFDIEIIKRHGRWVSNVVHVYLWEGSGFHSMAKKMCEAKFTLHAMM